jgi:hypothetical protein
MNSYSYLTAQWDEWAAQVDGLLASYDAPDVLPKK